MYLLDTDIVIYHLNGQPQARVLLRRLFSSPVFISSVTFMEVEEGIPRDSGPTTGRLAWQRLLERIVLLSFGESEPLRAAAIRRNLRVQGFSVRTRPLDVMIAATALEHGLILATNNEADYRGIPDLEIETP